MPPRPAPLALGAFSAGFAAGRLLASSSCAGAYGLAGRTAQHAFWGEGAPEQSMLHQIAGRLRG